MHMVFWNVIISACPGFDGCLAKETAPEAGTINLISQKTTHVITYRCPYLCYSLWIKNMHSLTLYTVVSHSNISQFSTMGGVLFFSILEIIAAKLYLNNGCKDHNTVGISAGKNVH